MTPDRRAEKIHRAVWDDLKAYADGELSPWRRRAVRRHLSGCAACQEEVDAMQQLSHELRFAEPVTGLDPALKARILSQVAAVPPLPAPRRPDRLLRYGFAASVAVSLVFAVLLVRTGVFQTDSPRASEGTRAAVPQSFHGVPPPPPLTPTRERMRAMDGASAMRQTDAPPRRAQDGRMASLPAPPKPAPTAPVVPLAVTRNEAEAPPKLRQQAARPSPNATPAPTTPPPALTVSDNSAASAPGSAAPAQVAKMSKIAEPQRTTNGGVPPPSPAPPMPKAPPPAPAPTIAPPPPSASAGAAAIGPAGAPPVAAFAPGPASRALKPGVLDLDAPALLGDWPVIRRPAGNDATASNTILDANWQVDALGRVSDVRFPATGDAALETALRDAIGKLRFRPAVRQGKPVAARMSHTFVIAP